MDKSDLLAYAKEYATTQDLYDLLGVTSDTPKEDIHRAWRKRSLKYHPDKAGANFDSAKWELFERARDVLSDAAAREIYDSQRSAALLREEQRRAMDAKRRAMVEDLEARERGAVKRPRNERDGPVMSEAERRRLVEAGKRRLEERQRLMREAEERERQREREQASKETQPGSEPPNQERHESRRTPDGSDAADSKMDIDAEPPAQNGDEYDDQIAALERRLQEARQRKAAKKEKKGGRKNGASKDEKPGNHQAQTTPTPDISGEQQADEKKDTSSSASGTAKTFSFSPATAPSNSTAAAGKPRAKGDFSSTMARLRAAQAEKDARRKAEEEAAAAAAGGDAGN